MTGAPFSRMLALPEQLLRIPPARHARPGQPFGDALAPFRRRLRSRSCGGSDEGVEDFGDRPGSIRNSGCHCRPKAEAVARILHALHHAIGCRTALTAAFGPGRRPRPDDGRSSPASWPPPTIRCSRVPGVTATRCVRAHCAGWAVHVPARLPPMESGMCWISVPPNATARSCCPPQIPSTGMSRAQRPLHQGQFGGGPAVLQGHGGDERSVAPYSAGETSKAPPVTTSPSNRSSISAARSGSWGSATGRPPDSGDWRRCSWRAGRTRGSVTSRRVARHPGSRR